MNKKQLVARLAKQSGRSQAAVDDVLTALAVVAPEILKEHGELPLLNIGKIFVRQKRPRSWCSPLTGKTTELSSRLIPAFHSSKNLRAALGRPD